MSMLEHKVQKEYYGSVFTKFDIRNLALLFVLLCVSEAIPFGDNICSGSCDFDYLSHSSSHCLDVRSCLERVKHDTRILEMFEDDDTECYRGKNLNFSVFLEKITVSVVNESLAINVSWHWPVVDVPIKKYKEYEPNWGLQYFISIPGEYHSNCYSVIFNEKSVQHGKFSIPCKKVMSGGFADLEVKVTFLAFVMERFSSDAFSRTAAPRRLQEITFSTAELLSKMPIIPWKSNLNYHYILEEKMLTVSFTPASSTYNYSLYEVKIFRAKKSRCISSGSYVDKIDVLPSWPTTTVNFSIQGYEECAKYCISVHPVRESELNNCSAGCVKEMHDMIFFHVTPQVLRCVDWNAEFPPQQDPTLNKISVNFNVRSGYVYCFNKFRMILLQTVSNLCKGGIWIKDTNIYWNFTAVMILFENIAPGNYCVKVEPIHKDCVRNSSICSVRSSRVVEISEPRSFPFVAALPDSDQTVENTYLIVSIPIAFGILIPIAVFLAFWLKSRTYKIVRLNEIPKQTTEVYGPSNLKQVSIVNASDVYQIQAFSSFLRKWANVNVLCNEDDEQSAFRHVDEATCRTITLNFTCNKQGQHNSYDDGKRIIIVKSERAVRLLKEKEILMERLMNSKRHEDDSQRKPFCIACELNEQDAGNYLSFEGRTNMQENLDKLFISDISHIINTRTELTDDCHIFVVQFSDSVARNENAMENLFYGHRYYIPQQLGDLFLNLNSTDKFNDVVQRKEEIERLQSVWRNDESYNHLLKACETQTVKPINVIFRK